MRTVLLLLLFFLASNAIAQEAQSEEPKTPTTKSYKVNPGQTIGEGLLNNGLYQYPKFMEAQVHFKNGNFGNGLLNYDRLTGKIQFIGPNGDTMALNNEPEINLIAIGKDTFYYSEGYVQKVGNFSARVAKQTMLELTNREKKGLY